jgi:hypothetical protein
MFLRRERQKTRKSAAVPAADGTGGTGIALFKVDQ